MKSLLIGLSAIALGTTGVVPTVANITTNDNAQVIKEKIVATPRNSLLTTAGDMWSYRREVGYVSINLGSIRQEQIVGINSPNNESFTDHKVESYDYYYSDHKAGIYTNQNFRKYFMEGTAAGLDWEGAVAWSFNNFKSHTSWGGATHDALGTINYLWHYDANNNLIIDIVGTLYVWAAFSGVEGVASIKLGSSLAFQYTE